MNNKQLGIGFWVKKETGNKLSHAGGLSEEQVAYLQSLKRGDRLILWANNRAQGNQPTHTLKKFEPAIKQNNEELE